MTTPGSDPAPSSKRGDLAAIALLSCAVILYEIGVTRILSVVYWYHWAFLCISLAMLGLGAPGVWLVLARDPDRLLRPLMLAGAALLPLSVIWIVRLGPLVGGHSIVGGMICMLLPLVCLGGAICLLLMRARREAIGAMYAADLFGAFVGALVIIPLLSTLQTPQLVGALGFLPLLACLLVRRKVGVLSVLLAAGMVTALVWGEPYALRFTKKYRESGRIKPFAEVWTPTARLTFFDSVFWQHRSWGAFAWGSNRPLGIPIKQYWIEQDGSAGTPVMHFDGDINKVRFLFRDVTTIGYQLRAPATVAIIGAGGGRDILTARLAGAKVIDAIELHGEIVEMLSTRLKRFSGNVYHLPGVNAIVGEGRSTLTRSSRRYDMIQISLIDSWAATAAGAYALSENNLYTVEAYRLYLRKLSDSGIVSTSRWIRGGMRVEVPRLLLLVREALRQEGVKDPAAHIAVLQGGPIGTVLASKRPFSAADASRLMLLALKHDFILHHPKTALRPRRSPLPALLRGDTRVFDAAGLRLEPPTDDKPFFFQVFSPLRPISLAKARKFDINAEGVSVLRMLMLATAAATLALFLLPFLLRRWFRPRPGLWRGSGYFVAIGLAFMFVEIPWIQRFVLYLGHPSYAITVVLACLLCGAAAGSALSSRLGLSRAKRVGLIAPLLIFGLNAAITPMFEATLGWSFAARVTTTAALLMPAAVVMGGFFPLGMLRFGDENKPWFWAVNGAAGVLASISSLALAMEIGFSKVALLGAGLYLAAWLLLQGNATSNATAAENAANPEDRVSVDDNATDAADHDAEAAAAPEPTG